MNASTLSMFAHALLTHRRPAWYVPLCAAFIASTGCSLFGAAFPANATSFDPPAVYARWWAMTEQCSGIRRAFDSITWYQVSGASRVKADDGESEGFWHSATNAIVLPSANVLKGPVVRHEMLHALTRAGHTREQFLERCAGIVDCSIDCVRDAGPFRTSMSDPAIVGDDALDVSVTMDPMVPRPDVDGGFFSMVVTARNPSARWIVYRSSTFQSLPVHTFAFTVTGAPGGVGGGAVAFDSSSIVFAPFESKRQVFDFGPGNNRDAGLLPDGTYTFRGAFGHHWVNGPSVRVGTS